MKQCISFRLGPMLKYTTSWVLYWNKNSSQFVLMPNYYFFNFVLSVFIGIILQAVFLLHLCDILSDSSELAQEDIIKQGTTNTKSFIACVGISIWITVATILSTSSLALEYKVEMAETLNQVFRLDFILKSKLRRHALPDKTKTIEVLMIFISAISLLVPFGFGFLFFHPANPVEPMIKNMFEVEFTAFSPTGFVMFFLNVFVSFCFSTGVIGWVLPAILVIFVSESWLNSCTPSGFLQPRYILGANTYMTNGCGKMYTNNLVNIYRSFQLLTNLFNCCTAKIRFACHSVATLTIAVLVSFALMRNGPALLADGSVLALTMAGFMLLAIFLVALLFYVECIFLDGLENRWQDFKTSFLCSCGRDTEMYKTAKSFGPVVINMAYPFCNVNISTFGEWFDTYINRLVDLLLTI